MRVVVVTTSFPRGDDDPSGHFVRSSARALARAGDEVHVIAPGGSALDAPKEQGGLVIHRAGGGGLFAWPGALARFHEAPWRAIGGVTFAAGVASRLARIGSVDRAVAHWIVPSAYPLLSLTRAPLEVHAHGADVRMLVKSPRPVRDAIMASLVDRDATFIFAARSLLDALVGSLPERIAQRLAQTAHVEPPPIDVPEVAEEARAKRASLESKGRVAIVACRLIASKRVELAIDAAREAGMQLVVVGDGPERKGLEERAAGGVLFTGALSRHATLAWIAAGDVLLHPSAVEAAPSVVREARALGIPVVACEAGDVRAWSEDDRGIVVVEANARAIAAAACCIFGGVE